MKVFVIMEGYYSDRDIDKIFTDEQLAKTYLMRKRANCSGNHERDSYSLRVYDTADNEIEFTAEDINKADKEIKMGYEIWLDENGEVDNPWTSYRVVYSDDDLFGSISAIGNFEMFVTAKDASDAEYKRCLKVARDRRMEVLANKKHIN